MTGQPQIVLADDALTVFTDGTSLQGPRRGGIGIHLVRTDHLGNETYYDLDEPGFEDATSNQMELMAVITALRTLASGRLPEQIIEGVAKVEVYTDSSYVADHVNHAIYEWPSKGWKTREGTPVLNADLWQELVRLYKRLKRTMRVDIRWGKGHSSSNPHNKTADKLAKQSARKPTRSLGRPVAVRRKKTSRATEVGSVDMLGQRLTIRIVSAEPVPRHGISRYRYEVISPGSPFYGCLDFAYSDNPMLRPGHTYYVTMGKNAKYPEIVKCHREVAKRKAGTT